MKAQHPLSTIFPYTTLFQSVLCSIESTPSAIVWSMACLPWAWAATFMRSEEHTSELQSHSDLVCRLLLEKKKLEQIVKLEIDKNKIVMVMSDQRTIEVGDST